MIWGYEPVTGNARGVANRKGRNPKFTSARSRWWTFGLTVTLVTVGVAACVLLGGRQFVLLQYYDQIEEMGQEVLQLRAEVELLSVRFQDLERDPFWAEELARERMNFAVPGEIIFRFELAS